MSALLYVIRIFWQESSIALRLGSLVFVSLPAFLGSEWGHRLAATLELPSLALPLWGSAAIIAAVIVFASLFTMARHAQRLDEEREPKIHLTSIRERVENRAGHGLSLRRIQLRAEVTGSMMLSNCLVHLEALLNERGEDLCAFTPIAFRTQHQEADKDAGPFHLRPGQPKQIEVAWLNEADPTAEIWLQYSTLKYPNATPRGDYTLCLVAAAERGLPDRKSYRLWVDDNRLRLEEKIRIPQETLRGRMRERLRLP